MHTQQRADELYAALNPDKNAIERKQLDALDATSLSPDHKAKIAAKFMELRQKNPKMKAHRAIRKAGEAYNVKFDFTA